MDITHDPITAGLVRALPAGKTTIEKRQLFTASGTWTRPAAMVGNPIVTMIGGGASGCSAGNRIGGDGGQYAIDLLIAIGAATNVSVTIGTGGAASTTTARNAGSSSSFGAFLTVLGGAGGTTYTGATCLGARGGHQQSVAGFNLAAGTPLGVGGLGGGSGGGGGGLELGDLPQVGGVALATDWPARGYGSGGGAGTSGTSGAGVNGACLVKWMETV
jgi:hypothetical protein